MSVNSSINAQYRVGVEDSLKAQSDVSFPEALATVRDWVRWSASLFTRHQCYFGHGTDNAWDEAVALVLHVCAQPFDRFEWVLDAKLDDRECQHVFDLACQRAIHKTPLPYLTGEAWFAGCLFEVNKHVLIPRSPIAELIENEFMPFNIDAPNRILDLCTGSGCIGILCALYYTDAYVDVADISDEALLVAQRNVARFNLQEQVQVLKTDVFSGVNDKYDVIVTNPPYVDAPDMASLPQEYHVEPTLALESGDDGLDITRQILAQASQYLTDNGILVCEVGNSFEALEAAFPQTAFYWPELEHGGHGVFMLTKAQCDTLLDDA